MVASMIKLILISIAISACSVSICRADSSKLTEVTNVAMDRVKDAAGKGANVVDKGAEQVSVHVEKLVNPQPHQAGQSNLVKSTARGLGRYAGGMTVEAGRTVRDIARSGRNFFKKAYSLTKDNLKQSRRRLYFGRKLSAQQEASPAV